MPRPSILPLLLCMALALIVRAWLAFHTQGFIDGDEALVGIQAQHILRGEFPIYFYNQPYMGSLEAYLMAALFAIAGASVWTLRAEPILLSLVVVWLTWKLAEALADSASLPLYVKQWFMNIAALLAAIPPLYDTVLEMRTLGGYIEIFILMLLLLLAALTLTTRRAAGASRRELAWRWAAIGGIIGLSFWVNPICIYAIFAVALWIGWDLLTVVSRAKRFTAALRSYLLPALAALPACVAGLTPALLWGAQNSWRNFLYAVQFGDNAPLRHEIVARYPTRFSLLSGMVNYYSSCVEPRLLGGALPAEDPSLRALHWPLLLLGAGSLLVVISLVALSFVSPNRMPKLAQFSPLLVRIRKLTALPLVFAAATSLIFCVTSTAEIGLWNCQYDLAGRYATPIMLALPFFYAAIFAAIVLVEAELYREYRRREETPALEPTGSGPARQGAALPDGLILQRMLLAAMVVSLIVAVFLQVGAYRSSDPGSTFQSPYCTFAPANNDAIIAYMQREHIHYAWANNWLAFPIDFKTGGSITVSDPMALIRHIDKFNRVPAYTLAVERADRPSLLALVKHSDPYPYVLQLLDRQQVTYRLARFPAQQGRDVLVITPLNQTVTPSTSDYFNVFVCSLDG